MDWGGLMQVEVYRDSPGSFNKEAREMTQPGGDSS